jgi:hypothetical protein
MWYLVMIAVSFVAGALYGYWLRREGDRMDGMMRIPCHAESPEGDKPQ